MVVDDRAVVERHRDGGEDTSALDGQAGSRSQGVADHAGVVQRQVGWLLEEEIIVPDAAAAGEAVGPDGDAVVVLDQVVPQQQAPFVEDAAAQDARRALCAKRREPIAADDAVRDARRAAVVDRSPEAWASPSSLVTSEVLPLMRTWLTVCGPGPPFDGPAMSIAEPLGPTCSEEPTLALTRLSSIVLWLRSIVERSLKWRAESKA